MKIALVSLVDPKFPGGFVPNMIDKNKKQMSYTPLALYLLAALTPGDIELTIVDENKESIDFERPTDLVGLHVMEPHAPRAREIAAQYRERGIKVVMGGFYPTLVPEEALEHCDAIVVGEAENVWGQLIRDFKGGTLQRIYRSPAFVDMKDIPIIRREVIPEGHEFFSVETTRGCPHRCEYCSVTNFYRNSYRNRPIEHVLEQIGEIEGNAIFFTDDNIISNRRYAKKLFGRLTGLGKYWIAQSSINIAKSDELLELAAESGCIQLMIGFETLRDEGMREINKKWMDPEEYPSLIKKIHDVGIAIMGFFIFGLDHDDNGVFERTVSFCIENNIEVPEFFILRPYRGTPLTERLIKENRVRREGLEEMATGKASYDPLQMSRQELERGYKWAWKEVYSKQAMRKRLSHVLKKGTSYRDSMLKTSIDQLGLSTSKYNWILGYNMALYHVIKDI